MDKLCFNFYHYPFLFVSLLILIMIMNSIIIVSLKLSFIFHIIPLIIFIFFMIYRFFKILYFVDENGIRHNIHRKIYNLHSNLLWERYIVNEKTHNSIEPAIINYSYYYPFKKTSEEYYYNGFKLSKEQFKNLLELPSKNRLNFAMIEGR